MTWWRRPFRFPSNAPSPARWIQLLFMPAVFCTVTAIYLVTGWPVEFGCAVALAGLWLYSVDVNSHAWEWERRRGGGSHPTAAG